MAARIRTSSDGIIVQKSTLTIQLLNIFNPFSPHPQQCRQFTKLRPPATFAVNTDLDVAAHARSEELVVVTINVIEFSKSSCASGGELDLKSSLRR